MIGSWWAGDYISVSLVQATSLCRGLAISSCFLLSVSKARHISREVVTFP
jgi:hypothetical protein